MYEYITGGRSRYVHIYEVAVLTRDYANSLMKLFFTIKTCMRHRDLVTSWLLLQDWKKQVMSEEAYFEELLQYHITLPRNISSQSVKSAGLQGNVCGADGITGTFKKLNVD